jgi:putative membrane protein
MMRILIGFFWLVLFVLLFGFALHNTAPADLRFFAGMEWRAPLVALLLVFFLAGVAFGFLAMLPLWFRQRLALRRLRRAASVGATPAVDNNAPTPESIQSVVQVARSTL